MHTLSDHTLPALTRWLGSRQILGLALHNNQLAVADTHGVIWVADNDHAARVLLDAVATSGRTAWAWRAQRVAIDLADRLQLDVRAFPWLRDATTAHGVVHPHIKFAPASALTRFGTTDPDLRPEPTHVDAGRAATTAAALVAELQTAAATPTRVQVLRSCEQENLWRTRQQKGWALDIQLLTAEFNAAETKRLALITELGIDLTRTATAHEKARIHAWLARVGIGITDRHGRPSLARDDYDNVLVPETFEAHDRWQAFRTARSVASRTAKLLELGNAEMNGRIYAAVNIRATRTGRGTVTTPALQNIHRDLRPLLRADPGDTLVSLDFGQIEPRIAAALSGDAALHDALESADFYTSIARRLWGEDAADTAGNVIPERRQQAKRLILGVFYGQGADAIGYEFKIPRHDAQELLNRLWGSFPDLQRYDRRLRAAVDAGQDLVTVSGRPIPPPRRGTYAALNAVVQANASDVFYDAVTRVAAATGCEMLFLGIHDELVLATSAEHAGWAAQVLNQQMPTTFCGVRVGGEAQVLGDAWRK